MLSRSERGQTLVEYGLLVALIAVVVIAALLFLGPVVSELFNDIGNTLDGATP
jgi:pilus assembly protein Flp/PilA